MLLFSSDFELFSRHYFEDNEVTDFGGAVFLESSGGYYRDQLNVVNSNFSGNKAIEGGGAVFANGPVTVSGGMMEKNDAPYGGAVYIYQYGTLTASDNAEFAENTAECGGAVYISPHSKATLGSSVFRGNQASDKGGAVYVDAAELDVDGATFTKNEAETDGGGVYIQSAPTTFSLTYFRNEFDNSGIYYDNIWHTDVWAANSNTPAKDISGLGLSPSGTRVFVGWATTPHGPVVYAPGDPITMDQNIILYARYQSRLPGVTPTTKTIAGTWEKYGSVLTVTWPGGTTSQFNSIYQNPWSINVPASVTLAVGDTITVVQTEANHLPSAAVTVTVQPAARIGSRTGAVGSAATAGAAEQGVASARAVLAESPGIRSAATAAVHFKNATVTENIAQGDGGGIYTTDYDVLKVESPVVFAGNLASAAYQLKETYDQTNYNTYRRQVLVGDYAFSLYDGSTLEFGYNNYDINYKGGGVVIRYTVTYNANGGAFTGGAVTRLDPVRYDLGDPVNGGTAPGVIPSREGYVFTGWFKELGCVSAWAFAADMVPGNLILYAGWTPVATSSTPPASSSPSPASVSTPPASSSSTSASSSSTSASSSRVPPSSSSLPHSSSMPVSPSNPTVGSSAPGSPPGGPILSVEVDDNPGVTLGLGNIPRGGLTTGNAWSLLSLLMGILGIIISATLLISGILKRNKKEPQDADEQQNIEAGQDAPVEEAEADENKWPRRATLRLLSLLSGIIPVILFFILDDLRLPMVWINRWTLLVGIFFLIHMVVWILFLALKKRQDDNNDDEQPEMPQGTA